MCLQQLHANLAEAALFSIRRCRSVGFLCDRLYLSCDAADRQNLQRVGKPLFKDRGKREVGKCFMRRDPILPFHLGRRYFKSCITIHVSPIV